MYNHDENIKIHKAESIGLLGSGADYTLRYVANTEKGYQVKDQAGRTTSIDSKLFDDIGLMNTDWDTKKKLIDGLNSERPE